MRDMVRLAELSHRVDALALDLCGRDEPDGSVEGRVVAAACGEREAVAVALSYALRRQERGGADAVNDRVIAALTAAVRRMGASSGQDGRTGER